MSDECCLLLVGYLSCGVVNEGWWNQTNGKQNDLDVLKIKKAEMTSNASNCLQPRQIELFHQGGGTCRVLTTHVLVDDTCMHWQRTGVRYSFSYSYSIR
jgi:hypothetical protein